MRAIATPTSPDTVLPLRVQYRQEMNCQIVHDSIHRRGWTVTFALRLDNTTAGFASVALGGPWSGKPTIFEFYILPAHRGRAFDLFEVFVDACGARRVEMQSNDTLFAAMLHAYAHDISSEAIVFRDALRPTLAVTGAILEQVTSDDDTRAAIAARQGGCEWRLRVGGEIVGGGGLLFHYNAPYADLYMDVAEPFRRRGLGAFLVQELKHVAYRLGSIPCARCGPQNIPSRKTLQKAGFVPYAHLLLGSIPETIDASA